MILFQTKYQQLTPRDGGADCSSEVLRVFKNSELRQFGEYRTRCLVLEAWDQLAGNGVSP